MLLLLLPIAALPVTGLRLLAESYTFLRMRAEATRAIGALREAGAVPVLLQNIRDPNARVRLAAMECLPGVMDAIAKEEMPLPAGEYDLCFLLGDRNESLVLSTLQVLRLHGDGSTAQPVERLVRRGRTERIRGLAEEILPVLQERLRREQDPALLVRPSMSPEDAPSELLRPAASEPDVDPSTLLRADVAGTGPSQ
jgi:hypothetical protein